MTGIFARAASLPWRLLTDGRPWQWAGPGKTDFEALAKISPLPPTIPVAQAIEELVRIWAVSDAAEWEDRLVWLPL